MRSKIKKNKPRMSIEAARVLKIGLPFIISAMIALTIKMQDELPEHPVTVLNTYPQMYEYILASLTLLILGAMLFDVVAKTSR